MPFHIKIKKCLFLSDACITIIHLDVHKKELASHYLLIVGRAAFSNSCHSVKCFRGQQTSKNSKTAK